MFVFQFAEYFFKGRKFQFVFHLRFRSFFIYPITAL